MSRVDNAFARVNVAAPVADLLPDVDGMTSRTQSVRPARPGLARLPPGSPAVIDC